MTRSTSTQRGASRRSTGSTASRGSKPRAASSRTSSSKSAKRAPSRARSTQARPSVSFAAPGVRVIVAVALVGLVWVLYPAMRLEYQASRHKAALVSERDAIAQQNAKVHKEVDSLKTPEGVEKEARESLGYAKRGDNVYVVVSPGSGATSGTASVEQADVNGRSIITVLLDAIFGVAQPSTRLEP